MLLLTATINSHGHYAHQKFYVIQPVTRVDSDLSSYDMIEWLEEQKSMRLTIRCEEYCHDTGVRVVVSSLKGVIMKLVSQQKSPNERKESVTERNILWSSLFLNIILINCNIWNNERFLLNVKF